MEAREDRDPGYDDWFDEPEPLTETQTGANRGAYEDGEEVWVLPEDEGARARGQREIVVAGRTLTVTQVAIVVASLLAVVFAILAAAGVFNGAKPAAQPVSPPASAPPRTTSTSTPANTTPTTEAPEQTLKPGDTGSQVKVLQRALAALGFSPGKPDGDYGPATQAAVERFQVSKKLAEDGIVGPATLAALQQALSR
jgi:Putative peptidoglycan binding domain